MTEKPDAYAFRSKKDGWITISRHRKPDFVAGATDEEIAKAFDVVEVKFKEEKA